MFLRASPLSAAAFTLPFALGACDELSYDGKIANSPNGALAGCQESPGSCNPDGVSSGLVAKLEGDPDTGELVIRFVTLTKNDDGSFTYDDGDDEVKLEGGGGVYSAADANLTLEEALSLDAVPGVVFVSKLEDGDLDEDTSSIGGDKLYGYVGYHTDASFIADSGSATYTGTAEIKLLVSDKSETGTSYLEVNFAEGTATLYAEMNSAIVIDEDTSFDELVSSNMTIDGYSFTGNQVSLYDGGLEVDLDDVVGADTSDAAAGMFFGDVDDGYPAEYGAVAVVTGDDDKLLVLADGELDP